MSNVLFYNGDSGRAAVGRLEGSSFETTQLFNDGSFSRGFTSLGFAHTGGLLFYNRSTGSAETGSLGHGKFVTTELFRPGSFAANWSVITGLPSLTLFYREDTGEGAIVQGTPIRTTKIFPPDTFARGWTHIVWSPQNSGLILFYNKANGRGAIVEAFDDRPPSSTPHFPAPNNVRTLVDFRAGSFNSGFTKIVETPDGKLLFYNGQDGSGALGIMDRNRFQTVASFPAGSFARGWTHIVRAGNSMLFYDNDDLSGAIGFNPTTKVFPAGSFGKWTLLASADDPPVIH